MPEIPLRRIMKVKIKITPSSKTNMIVGWHKYLLRSKISESPEKGKANNKLINYLSTILEIAKSDILIVKGFSQRIKLLEIRMNRKEFLQRTNKIILY